MELNSSGFEDFKTTLTAKKVKSSSRKRQKDVSKFIKSALASNTPIASTPAARQPDRMGRSGKKRAAACGSSTSKKRRIENHSWSTLLSEVQWPGLMEQESETSDINSYSEEEVEESDSIHTPTDESDDDLSDKGRGLRRDGGEKTRWRRTMDLLQSSTPPEQSGRTSTECIGDFESIHSSDGDSPSPRTSPHNYTQTASSFPTSNPGFQSTPDAISTPLSSPESDREELALTHTKPSEWLRGVALDEDTTHVTESDLNDTTIIMKTPFDSAKKIGSRRGRRRFVGGGLAEQLEGVVQREAVEMTFWEHRVKDLTESDIDTSSCLTVHVQSLVNTYSLFLASCTLIEGTPSNKTASPQVSETTPIEILVLFSTRCARSVNLRVGSRVRIHPPWQCLSLPSLSHELILSTLFCQSLEHAPSLTTPTSPVPCKQRGVADVVSASTHLTSSAPVKTLLAQSPVKSLPTSLCYDSSHSRHDSTSRQTLLACADSDRVLKSPCMLLDGIEHAQCGVVGGVTGRVVRVYRRNSRQLVTTVPPSKGRGQQSSLLQQSLCYCLETEGSKVIWCLLICDASGVCAEIQLASSKSDPWRELIQRGEGEVVHFTDIKLIGRTNHSRNREILSLISTLQFCPPLIPVLTGSQTTPLTSPPSFCYILMTGQSSHALSMSDTQGGVFPTVETVAGCGRMDLLGRVVYFSGECLGSASNENSSLWASCGADDGCYLHILTPSHIHTPSTTPHGLLLMVHLKPGFSVEGLVQTLSSPGASLLLRDVRVDPLGLEYSMDVCTTIIPLADRPAVYPVVRPCDEELALLHSLTTPDLPLLDQDTARLRGLVSVQGQVVSVDEDNAYSWPVCDGCGNNHLAETSSELQCETCHRDVITPDIHFHLTVFLKCKNLQNTQIQVTLLHSTISQLLPISSSSLDDGFDVHSVLGRWLSLPACCVNDLAHNTDGTVLAQLNEININFKEN